MLSTFYANYTNRDHLLDKPWLINQLGIVLRFGVSYQDFAGEARREKYVRQTHHKIPDICFIKGLKISMVS